MTKLKFMHYFIIKRFKIRNGTKITKKYGTIVHSSTLNRVGFSVFAKKLPRYARIFF